MRRMLAYVVGGGLLIAMVLEIPPPLHRTIIEEWNAVVPVTAQQFPVEPPVYPEGTLCTPAGDNVQGLQTPDHPCTCKRMSHGQDCESDVHEDAACLQWCHAQRCGCPLLCAPPDPDNHPEPEK